MIEKGTIMESEAEPSSKELLKIYDTTLAEKLMQKLLPMIQNCVKQTRSLYSSAASDVYKRQLRIRKNSDGIVAFLLLEGKRDRKLHSVRRCVSA